MCRYDIIISLAIMLLYNLNVGAGEKIRISLTGFGGVHIAYNSVTIYADAIAENTDSSQLKKYTDADFIMITHNDWDHFSAKNVAFVAKQTGATIIGPPSIAYELLTKYAIPPSKLITLYPPVPSKSTDTLVNNINFRAFQSSHFNKWSPIHISFIIELGGRKIYITGDSNSFYNDSTLKENIDALIVNLVEGKDNIGPYAEKLNKISNSIKAEYILPAHLIGCDFTIAPELLKQWAQQNQQDKIITLAKPDEEFVLN